MTYSNRIDLGVSAVVILVGAVFALEAWRIDPASYEAVGPRAVPLFLALVMVAMGAVIGGCALAGRSGAEASDPAFGFRDSDVARVVAVIASGAAYVAAFWAAGYLAATALGAALALWVFGVRDPPVLLGTAVAAAVVYQFVFMGLMGLLDPRGAMIDLRAWSRIVTPGS